MNIGYLIKRAANMNYKQMWEKVTAVHKKTGKSRLAIFKDMQYCARKFGAGYMDYEIFEFYNMTDEQRATYLTRGQNNDFVKQYNDPEYYHFFNNKDEFNAAFAEFTKRDFVPVTTDNRDEVLAFFEKHPNFMLKPTNSYGGKGIEKTSIDAYGSAEAAYEFLAAKEGIELEEIIVQHPAVATLHPASVNTVRIVTINKEGTVHIIGACCRIGNGGKNVDNMSSGGMSALVNEETGVVFTNGMDHQKNLYEIHPMTGIPIKGFAFPDWDEVVEMVKAAAKKIPEIGYTGWDVAFSEKGPCLVEGNTFPGHLLFQLPQHRPDKIGVLPKYKI